jgi:hypothetical protein
MVHCTGYEMGNFYTNMTLRAPRQDVVSQLKALNRDAYVAFVDGFSVVCDRECDSQDLDVIASLTATLSSRLARPTLSVLNHDDSVLLFGLFVDGALACEYGTSRLAGTPAPSTSKREFMRRIHETMGTSRVTRPQSLPWVASALFGSILAVIKHERLAAELGLPEATVGTGFRYVDRDDVPRAKKSDFLRV